MDGQEPPQFYTGLVAELYAPLRAAGVPDPEPYAAFITASGEPALELGCGQGDPLLALRARGLDVEGLDASADMLARLRLRAEADGVEVVVHHSTIEAMELRRHYQSIFLTRPTFNLLPDDDTAWHALERIRAHLEPGGTVRIALFAPERTERGALGTARPHITDDGAEMSVTPVSETRDVANRVQITTLRYELRTAEGDVRVEERPWLIHWYTQDGFRALAEEAGLRVSEVRAPDGSPAATEATDVVVWLEPDPTWDQPRAARTGGGAVVAAAMLGLEQVVFGERPKVQVVAEAEADGLDHGDIDLDLDDPAQSRITLAAED